MSLVTYRKSHEVHHFRCKEVDHDTAKLKKIDFLPSHPDTPPSGFRTDADWLALYEETAAVMQQPIQSNQENR